MIQTTVLLALAANALWLTPGYQNFIAPRKKRVELGDTPNFINAAAVVRENHPTAEYDRKTVNGLDVLAWYKMVEQNKFNRKPFTCLLCMSFYLGLMFYAPLLYILFKSKDCDFYSLAQVAISPFAVSFLSVLINRLYNSLPVKL